MDEWRILRLLRHIKESGQHTFFKKWNLVIKFQVVGVCWSLWMWRLGNCVKTDFRTNADKGQRWASMKISSHLLDCLRPKLWRLNAWGKGGDCYGHSRFSSGRPRKRACGLRRGLAGALPKVKGKFWVNDFTSIIPMCTFYNTRRGRNLLWLQLFN